MADEQTFLMVKPEGVQRGLVGEIISRFEKKGFKLVAMKFVHAPSSHLEEHYKEHKGKPFFERVVKDMSSGPVVPMVFQGKGIIKAARVMLGETDPLKSNPGTIRGDFGISVGRNICHGSDSLESSRREIQLWFKEGEVFQWKPVFHDFLYED